VFLSSYLPAIEKLNDNDDNNSVNSLLEEDHYSVNPSTPNVNYSGRTAPLTSKVAFYIFIQQI